MFVRSRNTAPRREREGLLAEILLQQGDVASNLLAVTWVEVAPGGQQLPHEHVPEQVYVIIQGQGRMRVGDDEREVAPGDLVYIPSQVSHGIVNTSSQPLVYISAATPAFDLEALYDSGQLRAP